MMMIYLLISNVCVLPEGGRPRGRLWRILLQPQGQELPGPDEVSEPGELRPRHAGPAGLQEDGPAGPAAHGGRRPHGGRPHTRAAPRWAQQRVSTWVIRVYTGVIRVYTGVIRVYTGVSTGVIRVYTGVSTGVIRVYTGV